MQDILFELHKAEGILQKSGVMSDDVTQYRVALLSVLSKRDIPKSQFDSSLVWYTAHPKRFERVYPEVISRLESEQSRIDVEEVPGSVEVISVPDSVLPSDDIHILQHRWMFLNHYPDTLLLHPYRFFYIADVEREYYLWERYKFLYIEKK